MKTLMIFLIGFGLCACSDSPTGEKKIEGEKQADNAPAPASQIEQKGEVALEFYEKKRASGIDFYAVGNEPFWALDMNFSKGFKFTTPEFEFNCPPVFPVTAQDAPVKRYRAETELGELIIRLSNSGCTDNMSGQEFSHKVFISLKRGIDSSYTEFKGCGRYVPDVSLHDIWGLIEFSGETYPNKKMPGGAQLELFPVDERVLFSDGCNSFSGSFHTEEKKIHFGNLAGTLKACPDQKINTKIATGLATTAYRYEKDGRNLTFYNDSIAVYRWRKID